MENDTRTIEDRFFEVERRRGEIEDIRREAEDIENESRELEAQSHETKLKLNTSKKEFSKVAKQYQITLELLNRYQTLGKTLKLLTDSLLGKTTEANKLIQSSKGVTNNKHILQ